jgi:hypothetical protein
MKILQQMVLHGLMIIEALCELYGAAGSTIKIVGLGVAMLSN